MPTTVLHDASPMHATIAEQTIRIKTNDLLYDVFLTLSVSHSGQFSVSSTLKPFLPEMQFERSEQAIRAGIRSIAHVLRARGNAIIGVLTDTGNLLVNETRLNEIFVNTL